jgi:fluoride exporter
MKFDLRILLAIAIGGAIGSVARYALNVAIQSRFADPFPLGIMVINVGGSFLLGFLMRFSLETTVMSPEVRLFLTTGFCGGFTTFSTFSYDALTLFETGPFRSAWTYLIGSVALSVLGAFTGVLAAHQLGVLLRSKGVP